MEQAIVYKNQHPSENYSAVAKHFDIPKSTLQARISRTHDAWGHWTSRTFNNIQEAALLGSISAYTG